MKPEYLEPWKRIYPTKNELLEAWSDWFESKSDEWDLFTLTAVFKSGGLTPRPNRWESEYKTRILQKIRRALEPKLENQTNAIPYEEFFITRRTTHHYLESLDPISLTISILYYLLGSHRFIDSGLLIGITYKSESTRIFIQ
jgi:hypothetical protein